MRPLILIGCFFPIALIWIVMKLSVWIAAVNSEQEYVREDTKRPHGPYMANAYADVDEEEEEYGSKRNYR